MADDKIVTKKTAVKKAVVKKTADKKSPVGEAQASPVTTATRAAPPVAEKQTPAKSTARKSTPPSRSTTAKTTKTADKAPDGAGPAAPQKLSDHKGSLRQFAKTPPEQRLDMIREAAYYKAEKRHFAPGHEAEDWADAEREIDELLARAKVMTGD
ncbi:DUF2934 domain-containing protein [Thiocystis violacea]|uniref:DUF2934 domain-containing protein n=1 Tax=Thiocystis violacea TaxID=13725 RepID=UPI001905980C|nr:DUF2934 domain-containing protein [Thiocystis violacea]